MPPPASSDFTPPRSAEPCNAATSTATAPADAACNRIPADALDQWIRPPITQRVGVTSSSLEKPLLSIAGAAGLLQCPTWVVHLLVERKLLHATRVQGTPRIRHRELEALRRTYDPSYRTESP